MEWDVSDGLSRGEVGIGVLIFYVSSFFVLLSVPITVYLLRSTQEQLTGAAVSSPSFSKPPSIELFASPPLIRSGDSVTFSVSKQDSNWYVVYFSSEDPTNLMKRLQAAFDKDSISRVGVLVYQGDEGKPLSYMTRVSGSLLPVSYQLQSYFGDFRSGDIMCGWDGQLYLFKRTQGSIFLGILRGNSETPGFWQRLTTCSNSGPFKVEVVSG